METNLSELLHLLSDEKLLRLERRAQLQDKNFLASILLDEMSERAMKDQWNRS